jgi:ABC-type bacteriocin/lantibiotic exporter with double-glycine peptidase domain
MIRSDRIIGSFLLKEATLLTPSDKKVIKTKAIREIDDADVFLEVPIIRQSASHTCGAACFLSILGYYGYDPNEKKIIKVTETTIAGTDTDGFEKAAKIFNLKCRLKENMTYDQLRESVKDKIPVILAIQAWGNKDDYSQDWKDGHFVTAVGYDKKGFFLMDPAQMGYSYISDKKLEGRWHDMEKDSEKIVRMGIMIYGKEPKFDYDRVRPID